MKDTSEYIGEAGILSVKQPSNRAVVGYNLLPRYWANGYATEITEALVKYLFIERNVERIEGLVQEENISSRKVLEKNGFLKEGTLRNFAFINNLYKNVCYYGIIKEDYNKNKIKLWGAILWSKTYKNRGVLCVIVRICTGLPF